jgi:choline dehydrogenase-like flavoprotein
MPEKKYDAIVVGSGATGGYAAKELAERGLEVLVLEAGPYLKEDWFHTGGGFDLNFLSLRRVQAFLKGQHKQARYSLFSVDKSFMFVNDRKNPYKDPGDSYLWVRGRNVGGRFLSWGRVAIRMSDYDFKAASHDGFGQDWPISYDELVPYYDQVEDFLGIVGTREGLANMPDGKYVRQAGLSRLERLLKEKVESTWPERHIIPWRYTVEEATPPDETGRYRISSPLAAAQRTGRMELRANAVAKQVDVDPNTGKASGVTYIDALTKQSHHVPANVVVVCASTIESVRLLLNSACAKHPAGLGNSSGTLGRYFMDQCPSMVFGTVPGETGGEVVDGTSFEDNHGGIYIPRFQNLDGVTHPKFKRGYNIQGVAGRSPVPEGARSVWGFMGQGEMLPHAENRVTVDRRKRDAWGIPVARIAVRMSENERQVMLSEVETITEHAKLMGWELDFAACSLGILNEGKLLPFGTPLDRLVFRMAYRRTTGLGSAIHECGGARMGDDPATSVLNSRNQMWDAKNVFVTDSSCFASNGTCGPTLTTMALTVRACEYIANEYGKSGEIS